MKPWELLLRNMWVLVRDVAFAGFGLWLIWRETTRPARSVEVALALIGVGVGLTMPSAAEHIKAILPSSGEPAAGSPSRSSAPHGPSHSPTSPGVPGEH